VSVALGVVLLLVGALSGLVALRVHPGPDADQVRGFCVVGAMGCVATGLAVLGIGALWDGRIADTVAIVALFAMVVYYLVAVLINRWPARTTTSPTTGRPLDPDAEPDPASWRRPTPLES
jgi:hypothetical protein